LIMLQQNKLRSTSFSILISLLLTTFIIYQEIFIFVEIFALNNPNDSWVFDIIRLRMSYILISFFLFCSEKYYQKCKNILNHIQGWTWRCSITNPAYLHNYIKEDEMSTKRNKMPVGLNPERLYVDRELC